MAEPACGFFKKLSAALGPRAFTVARSSRARLTVVSTADHSRVRRRPNRAKAATVMTSDAPAGMGKPPLHIALVEPEIPPNTGNVARLCAATGCRLHLIEPLGFSIDDRALKRAGLDYWHLVDLRVHPSLCAFLKEFEAEAWLFSTRGGRLYTDADFAPGDALVFGKETAGLPQELLDRHPERSLRIPMRDRSVRSINLSTSVGIATYAALAALSFPNLS